MKPKTLKEKQEAIIKFMEWKGSEIKNRVRVTDYFNKHDAAEIRRKMTSKQADSFIYKLCYEFDEGDICPFCTMYKRDRVGYDCGKGGYGNRHGICINEFDDSKYKAILGSGNLDGIVTIIGRIEIKWKVKELFLEKYEYL